MITKVENAPVILTSTGDRITLATRAAVTPRAGETNTKTPDYHLPYTGDQVNEGIKKSLELDPNSIGAIKVLPSTKEAPYNIDTMMTPGGYVTNYMTAATFPAEFSGLTPISLDVTTKPGSVIQVIESGGNKYYRWTKDNGIVWSEFAPKSTNSGPIDTTGDPTEPPKEDPMVQVDNKFEEIDTELVDIKKDLANIGTSLGSVISLGAAEVATKILNGTFDYDTQS